MISEKSPYLLQHAYNPVDWYPWGEEAFEKAKRENKPVFLSIGYSTCHWCHVMEKESFEDDAVAGAMNDAFVSIKVDREERPDLDGIYMAACQSMTGSGGWPLNIILTPDKKPFFAATYIPKETKFGRAGMLEIIPRIKDLWKLKRDELEASALQVVSALKEVSAPAVEGLDEEVLHEAYVQLLEMFDERHGGFGETPKFPTPHSLTFLLRYWRRTGDKMALHIVEKTLQAMRMGGIFDHIGFGFHRYSVDSGWLVPHFEKMLYDQAMLAMAYTEAYQATGKEEYGKTAREIFTYVLRDMTSSEGGFYSGEDADSEGEEGKFYLWTEDEIQATLSGDESELIKEVFNVDKDGNFTESKGRNILHLKKSLPGISSSLKVPVEDFENRLEGARRTLFAAREKRIHPAKDDKIITDWNGLMIAALARGAAVFDEPAYARAALRGADFILSRMRDPGGRLYHRYRDGEVRIAAFLDDYAFLTWGLIELYETTFEVSYLRAAMDITSDMIKHFRDEENGGFYFTADDAEEVIVRKKEFYDGAVPSGNSVAMLNLLRLGRMAASEYLENEALRIQKAFSKIILRAPSAYTQLLSALDFALGPPTEVVIAGGRHDEDTKAMVRALRKEFIPNKVVIFRPAQEESPEILRIAEYARYLTGEEGRATAYVCSDYSCKQPTTDPKKLMNLLMVPE